MDSVLTTQIPENPEYIVSYPQNDGKTLLLVDLYTQEHTPAAGTSTISLKNPPATSNISNIPPRLPPLPGFQILDPIPYKGVAALLETSHTLREPKSDPTLPKKSTTAHQTGQFCTPRKTHPSQPLSTIHSQ